MKYLTGDFGLIFIVHCLLIFLVYLSPVILAWPFILLILLYLFFQELFLGGCILSRIQFGKKYSSRIRFFSYYFKKFGWRFNDHRVDIFFVWLVPVFIFILAIILQKSLIVVPLINI